MANYSKLFSGKKNQSVLEDLEQLLALPGVNDCVLLDRKGALVYRASSSVGHEKEIVEAFYYTQAVCAISELYSKPEEGCENIHLRCSNGEIVFWDIGPLIIVITGSGIKNTVELRLKVNLLKSSINNLSS